MISKTATEYFQHLYIRVEALGAFVDAAIFQIGLAFFNADRYSSSVIESFSIHPNTLIDNTNQKFDWVTIDVWHENSHALFEDLSMKSSSGPMLSQALIHVLDLAYQKLLPRTGQVWMDFQRLDPLQFGDAMRRCALANGSFPKPRDSHVLLQSAQLSFEIALPYPDSIIQLRNDAEQDACITARRLQDALRALG